MAELTPPVHRDIHATGAALLARSWPVVGVPVSDFVWRAQRQRPRWSGRVWLDPRLVAPTLFEAVRPDRHSADHRALGIRNDFSMGMKDVVVKSTEGHVKELGDLDRGEFGYVPFLNGGRAIEWLEFTVGGDRFKERFLNDGRRELFVGDESLGEFGFLEGLDARVRLPGSPERAKPAWDFGLV